MQGRGIRITRMGFCEGSCVKWDFTKGYSCIDFIHNTIFQGGGGGGEALPL